MGARFFFAGTVLLLSAFVLGPIDAMAQLPVQIENTDREGMNDFEDRCVLAMVSAEDAMAGIEFDPARVDQAEYWSWTARAALSLMYYRPSAEETAGVRQSISSIVEYFEENHHTDYNRLLGIVFSNALVALSDSSGLAQGSAPNTLTFPKIGVWSEELSYAGCLALASVTLAYADEIQ